MLLDESGPNEPDEDELTKNLGPEIPTAPNYSNQDAPPELRRAFWSSVLLFNVALFGLSLGLMLIGFQQRWLFGGGLVLIGLVAFVRGWLRYRNVQKD